MRPPSTLPLARTRVAAALLLATAVTNLIEPSFAAAGSVMGPSLDLEVGVSAPAATVPAADTLVATGVPDGEIASVASESIAALEPTLREKRGTGFLVPLGLFERLAEANHIRLVTRNRTVVIRWPRLDARGIKYGPTKRDSVGWADVVQIDVRGRHTGHGAAAGAIGVGAAAAVGITTIVIGAGQGSLTYVPLMIGIAIPFVLVGALAGGLVGSAFKSWDTVYRASGSTPAPEASDDTI